MSEFRPDVPGDSQNPNTGEATQLERSESRSTGEGGGEEGALRRSYAGVSGVDFDATGRFFHVADTGLANTDFTVPHNLGTVPRYYSTETSSQPGQAYDGSTGRSAWTATTITLRHPAANADIWVKIHA